MAGNPRKAFRRVAEELAGTCGAYSEAMKADVLRSRSVAIGPSLLFAPRLLRETDGVPCATAHLAPSVFRSDISPARLVPHWITPATPELVKRLAWWTPDSFYDRHFTAPLNSLRAELGLPRVERIFRSWVHEADCVIGIFPSWCAPPQADWPGHIVLTGFPLHDDPLGHDVADFIDAGPPPIAFSAGTATATAHRLYETWLEACRQARIRAIFLSHFAQQVPASLPPDVMHVSYAPFGALLPKVAAFVHHGGTGSITLALRAGVPQLIRLVAYDQFDNAIRAVRLGVAKEALPNTYRARSVAHALEELTCDHALRERCRRIAARLGDANSIQVACGAILARLRGPAPEQLVQRTVFERR